MENKVLTANQVYKNSVKPCDKIKFGQWMDIEKNIHLNARSKDDFDTWLNAKYTQYPNWWSVQGEATKSTFAQIVDKANSTFEAAKDTIQGNKDTNDAKPEDAVTTKPAVANPPVKKTIIGLSPVVFWGGAGVIIVGLAYAGYRMFKKS